jgi:hypothetical protein
LDNRRINYGGRNNYWQQTFGKKAISLLTMTPKASGVVLRINPDSYREWWQKVLCSEIANFWYLQTDQAVKKLKMKAFRIE